MMKTRTINGGQIAPRDVKAMWKACDKAKDDAGRAKYVAVVQRVTAKVTGAPVALEKAEGIAVRAEPILIEYGKIRTDVLAGRAMDLGRIGLGAVAFAGGIVCLIAAGEEIKNWGSDGTKMFAAGFIGAPIGAGVGTFHIIEPMENVVADARKLARAATEACEQVLRIL